MRVRLRPLAVLVAGLALATPAVVSASPANDDANHKPPTQLYSKRTAVVAVGATWAAIGTWAYFAWFHDKERIHDEVFIDYDSFSPNSYAGGADKLGHFWSGHVVSRITAETLIHGGWPRLQSSLVASGMHVIFSTFSEYKDTYIYSFEVGDLVANVAGASLSVLLINVPTLDRLFDYRLEYFPTAEYRRSLRHGNVDGAQDYTGQSYMLALHLSGIPHLTDSDEMLWGRYVDVVVGFESHNYLPVPDDPTRLPQQTFYAGISLNMQGVLCSLFKDSVPRRIGHGAAEFISLPFTTFRYLEASRSPTEPIR